MHRAAVVIHYELINVAGLLLPSRMAAEVAVTGQCGSATTGAAFLHGRYQACRNFCSYLDLNCYFREF